MKYRFFLTGYLSNWYECDINYDGNVFANSEQLYMFLKAKTFGDVESMNNILATISPKEAKELGRTVANFNPKIWDNVKYEMMYLAVLAKFTQNPSLREKLYREFNKYMLDAQKSVLFDSENSVLFVECNPLDRVWGIGYSVAEVEKSDPANWGQNLLGKILTEIAAKINL
jgi:ribA/ribD-fused uncharacterized protein